MAHLRKRVSCYSISEHHKRCQNVDSGLKWGEVLCLGC